MKVGNISDTHRGWVIGDFEPSLLRTKDFEVGILKHPKGEKWPAHYHKIATEYNILISGTMRLCDVELVPGNTFILEPNEVADPIFHEDCIIVCIKVPSNTSDKYLV
jgi:quercetin dioxygenase-like cupin family protein